MGERRDRDDVSSLARQRIKRCEGAFVKGNTCALIVRLKQRGNLAGLWLACGEGQKSGKAQGRNRRPFDVGLVNGSAQVGRAPLACLESVHTDARRVKDFSDDCRVEIPAMIMEHTCEG